MILREAKMEEWEQIYNISKKNGKLLGPVLPPEIRAHIDKNECLVCIHNEQVVAFILYTLLKKIPTLLMVNVICVDTNYRGKKLASNMVKHLQKTYNRDIKATCIKDSESELFWSKVAIKQEELPGKKRPICRYLIKTKRRNLLDGI